MKETKIRYVIIMTAKLIKMTLESINILAHFHRQEKFAGTQFCCLKLISIASYNYLEHFLWRGSDIAASQSYIFNFILSIFMPYFTDLHH